MITSYEAFQKRVKIGDSCYIVPIEVVKELERLDSENDKLREELTQLNELKNVDEYETSSKIIINLMSDRMGTSRVLNKSDYSFLDDYWVELEGRIINGLRGETITGKKFTPDMLPKLTGSNAEEYIRSRRQNQLKNSKGIEVVSNRKER